MKRSIVFVLILLLTACSVPSTDRGSGSRSPLRDHDPLFSTFRHPPAESRPFVRWWWNGNRVEEDEIRRELQLLDEAGIGGVEINPIAMPEGAKETDTKPLTWLSPEWNRMAKTAVDEARKRGMKTDMIVGTGWPFGGTFLPPEEQIQGVVLQKFDLNGPGEFEKNIDQLIKRKRTPENVEDAPAPELLFLRLVPKQLNALDQIRSLTDQVQEDGTVKFSIPDGEHVLYLGTVQKGVSFRTVTHGAPGASGPVLDHYNRSAVRRYLDRVASSLGPKLGGKLGPALRALFVDSIELSGSNWTNDLPEVFQERRGYSLDPYYPFLFQEDPHKGYRDHQVAMSDEVADEIKRVRYDFSRTLMSLFLDRFTKTFDRWCEKQNVQSRYQSYGTPWNMGLLEGAMIPDIPEGNNWLYSRDLYTHGPLVWNKYISSAAHLTGKSVISNESMTNIDGTFQTPLSKIKRADDLNFIQGLTHAVLHGFNYSPPEAGFPGWVRYGTYFSEQNTWWPFFRNWVDYNARLSSLFQSAKPQHRVAILAPRADHWSQFGMERTLFQASPGGAWYANRIWEGFHRNGLSADHITGPVLQETTVSEGEIRSGNMEYTTLVLANVRSMQLQTAKKVRAFVRSGGTLVFVENLPNRSPTFSENRENDQRVRDIMKSMLENRPDRVSTVDPPDAASDITSWATTVIETSNLHRDVHISSPDDDLYQVHYAKGERSIYFFANQSTTKTIEVDARFPTGKKTPWIWNPHDGSRRVYPFGDDRSKLTLRLRPSESLLLVFEPTFHGSPEGTNRIPRTADEPMRTIEGPWSCEFDHARNDSFEETLDKLINFGDSEKKRLNTFAGTVTYNTEFEVQDPEAAVLDLGEVHGISEVSLNGTDLGTTWWGEHLYDVRDELKPGTNTLTVTLTTVLYNYVRSLTDNATAKKWTDADRTVPAGMVGPVRLYPVTDSSF